MRAEAVEGGSFEDFAVVGMGDGGEEAVKWYRLAANQGNENAKETLEYLGK